MKVANPLKKVITIATVASQNREIREFAKKERGLNYSFEHSFFDPIEYTG